MILDLEIPHDDTWLLLWCELNDHIPYNRDLGLVRLGVVCFHDGTPALQLLEVVLGVGVGDVAQLDAHTTDPILKHGPEKPHDPL